MKKTIICIAFILLGAFLHAYPMFSTILDLNIYTPFIDLGDLETDSYNDDSPLGSLGGAIDGAYAFKNGLTIGAEASLLYDMQEIRWGLAPMVGYSYVDNFFFQALLYPLSASTNAGIPISTSTSLNYSTGLKLYIGTIHRYLFPSFGSPNIGLGFHSLWGRHEWDSSGKKDFSTSTRLSISISLRFTGFYTQF